MVRKIHKFNSRYYNHLFNISEDRGVIFYCVKDYLIFLSLIYHYATLYNIVIVSLCIMVNHFHILTKPTSQESIRKFMQGITSHFSKLYNEQYDRKGALFKKPFGYSQKYGAKAIRTTISYILNNPVEKRIVKQADQYRWNFISYAISDNPFSESLIIRNTSKAFQKALKSFISFKENSKCLSYNYLDNLFRPLSSAEKDQMIDYIIKSYNCIDFQASLSFFESNYDRLIIASNSNTGSDPDIPETLDRSTDVPYRHFFTKLKTLDYDWKEAVFHMDRKSEEFNTLLKTLFEHTLCNSEHLNRFFHT